MSKKQRRLGHTVTWLSVHIVWVTKYRYKVLGEIFKTDVENWFNKHPTDATLVYSQTLQPNSRTAEQPNSRTAEDLKSKPKNLSRVRKIRFMEKYSEGLKDYELLVSIGS